MAYQQVLVIVTLHFRFQCNVGAMGLEVAYQQVLVIITLHFRFQCNVGAMGLEVAYLYYKVKVSSYSSTPHFSEI